MKKLGLIFSLITFFTSSVYSISPSELRDIMGKDHVTIGDALFLLTTLDNPDAEMPASMPDIPRLKNMKMDQPLNLGSFSIMAIEMKKAEGSIFYSLTGFSKFATESLAYRNVFKHEFSFNRTVDGKELIEFVSALRDLKK